MKLNFKNMTMVLAATTLMTSSFSVEAKAKKGGDSGGGGGAYMVAPGKYLLFPEAGILIRDTKATGKRFEKYYSIKDETKKELESILKILNKELPDLSLRYDEIIADKDTYVEKEIDLAEYERIKTEYKAVFQKAGYKLDEAKFVLPAYSEGEIVTRNNDGYVTKRVKAKTYILPDFNAMTPFQQAKKLIHEYNMRKNLQADISRQKRLKFALAADVVINDALNGKDVFKIDLSNALRNLSNIELYNDSKIVGVLFKNLSEEIKENVDPDDIFLSGQDVIYKRGYNSSEPIDPSLVQALQDKHQLKNNYAEMLEGASVSVIGKEIILPIADNADAIKELCRNEISLYRYSMGVYRGQPIVYECQTTASVTGNEKAQSFVSYYNFFIHGQLEFFKNTK